MPRACSRGPRNAHRHAQAVSGVRLHRDRMRHRAAHEAAHEVAVPLEAAGRQHDATMPPTSTSPSGEPRRTPTTRPPSVKSSRPAVPFGVDPAVETALQQATDETLPGAPLVMDLAPCISSGGTPPGAPRPSEVSLIAMLRPICGPIVALSAHGPSWSNENSGHSSDRPPPGFAPDAPGGSRGSHGRS